MRRGISSALFVLLGAGIWGAFSTAEHFSVKKWDAAFESALHNTLTRSGLSDTDIISSVHEIQSSKSGSWVIHSIELKKLKPAQLEEIKKGIQSERLTGKGYGESMLVNECADNVKCSEEDHQLNRRSEFIITSN